LGSSFKFNFKTEFRLLCVNSSAIIPYCHFFNYYKKMCNDFLLFPDPSFLYGNASVAIYFYDNHCHICCVYDCEIHLIIIVPASNHSCLEQIQRSKFVVIFFSAIDFLGNRYGSEFTLIKFKINNFTTYVYPFYRRSTSISVIT
jgi:hypothetical protein